MQADAKTSDAHLQLWSLTVKHVCAVHLKHGRAGACFLCLLFPYLSAVMSWGCCKVTPAFTSKWKHSQQQDNCGSSHCPPSVLLVIFTLSLVSRTVFLVWVFISCLLWNMVLCRRTLCRFNGSEATKVRDVLVFGVRFHEAGRGRCSVPAAAAAVVWTASRGFLKFSCESTKRQSRVTECLFSLFRFAATAITTERQSELEVFLFSTR